MTASPDFINKTRKFKTPFLVFSLAEIKSNYRRISRSFPGVEVFYAVKCNPNSRIIETLNDGGARFEVASIGETKQLLAQGVKAEKIICLHPIKSSEFLKYLAKIGISIVAADSYEEVDKIAKFAPGSKIAVRVAVDNEGSAWSLSGKFGMQVTEFPNILLYIKSKGLVPYGLTFHVGSQCENESNWIKALDVCHDIWKTAGKNGIALQYLSLGGGLAVKYTKPVPEIEQVGELVSAKLKQNFASPAGTKFSIEPGRAIAATSGILVNTVFGLAKRGNKNWAYIESGTYNGLVEAIETSSRKFYPLFIDKKGGKKIAYNIGGPSCVTIDTPFEDVDLPELTLGDRLYILNYGAYNLTCSSPFNGFPIPKVYFWEDLA